MPVHPTYIRLTHTGLLPDGRSNPDPVVITDLNVTYGDHTPGSPISVPVGGFVDVLLSFSAVQGQIARYVGQRMLLVSSAYQRLSEKDQANGYVGLDATTKVPTGKLGTGVADATSFLRGDRTWTAVAAGITDHSALSNLDAAHSGHTGFATLDPSSKVIQNPADATATPSGSKIPIAGVGGTLAAGWLPVVTVGAVGATPALPNPSTGAFLRDDGSWATITVPEPVAQEEVIGVSLDGSGAVIVAGSKGHREVSVAGTILAWTLLADVAGDLVVDVRRATYAAWPTTETICGGAPPALVGVQKTQGVAGGCVGAVLASGDVLEFVVTGVPVAITKAWLFLRLA